MQYICITNFRATYTSNVEKLNKDTNNINFVMQDKFTMCLCKLDNYIYGCFSEICICKW